MSRGLLGIEILAELEKEIPDLTTLWEAVFSLNP